MNGALTLIDVERNEDYTVEDYTCDVVVECDGTSIWTDTADMKVHVTGITVITEEDGSKRVNVTHDADWRIYTDRGFEKGISELLGLAVGFTEQGMQEDNLASMEC